MKVTASIRLAIALVTLVGSACTYAAAPSDAKAQIEIARFETKVPGARFLIIGNVDEDHEAVTSILTDIGKLSVERGSLWIVDAHGSDTKVLDVLGGHRPNWVLELTVDDKSTSKKGPTQLDVSAGSGTDAFPVVERLAERLNGKVGDMERLKDGFESSSLLGWAEKEFRSNAIRIALTNRSDVAKTCATQLVADCAKINNLMTPPRTLARRAPSSGPVRLAILTVSESGEPTSYKGLRSRDDLKVEFVRGRDIRAGRLDDFDVLLAPGGSGSQQAAKIGPDGREMIRDFVHSGGGYFGICAGGYLASSNYDWGLALLDARTVDREHWARGKGIVEIELNAAGRALLQAGAEHVRIWYGNGPILARNDRDDIPDFEILAEYRSEVVKDGVPTGVMPNTPAAVRAPFGHGRVIVFSCHPDIPKPESTEGLLDWLPRMVYWAAGREAPAE